MNLATRLLNTLLKPTKHHLTINTFATVKALDTMQQLRFQFLKRSGCLGQTRGLVVLEPPEAGTDNLAGRLIQAALHLFLHKLCQFRRQ